MERVSSRLNRGAPLSGDAIAGRVDRAHWLLAFMPDCLRQADDQFPSGQESDGEI